MTTKLTISLDSKVIERAKKYAQAKEESLSKVISDLLEETINQEQQKRVAKMKELSGKFKLSNPSLSLDDLRSEALKKKYDL
jgi:macrodomain Ter protein organizer (MatP/YcbG family)